MIVNSTKTVLKMIGLGVSIGVGIAFSTVSILTASNPFTAFIGILANSVGGGDPKSWMHGIQSLWNFSLEMASENISLGV